MKWLILLKILKQFTKGVSFLISNYFIALMENEVKA